ncbi:MAG: formylglycine-generating enzyme family protein [Elusimicrobiota bacterium]
MFRKVRNIICCILILIVGAGLSGVIPSEANKKYEGMVLIPAGEFTMGSESGESDEKPPHKVYLDAYYIDKYEVTFEQYDKFCEATGRKKPSHSGWGRGNRPVIDVNWNDAMAYAKWAEKRLPTEAEWEKAARAGSNTKYCFGDGESELGNYAWYDKNSGGKTHPVGSKKPNQYGIYDMHGNVWEWCADWYDKNYYSVVAGTVPAKNPKGPDSGEYRVLRGGSWYIDANFCRSAIRVRGWPHSRGDYEGYFRDYWDDCWRGFRCAATVRTQ